MWIKKSKLVWVLNPPNRRLMNSFYRTLIVVTTFLGVLCFAGAPVYAQNLGDAIVDGAKNALDNPNLGDGAGRNISDLDTAEVDGRGNTKEGDKTRANLLLNESSSQTPYLHEKMFAPGNSSRELGESGARNLAVRVARDSKNILIAISGFLLLISVLRLIFAGAEEEEAKKLKTTVIWATLGIVIMQSAFAFVEALFGKSVDADLARDFSTSVLGPITRLLQVLASFAFIAAAFYGFYKMLTAHGEEDQATQGKTVFINAILGFMVLKLIEPFIYSLYGHEECKSASLLGADIFKNCELTRNVGDTISLVSKVLNWINGFIAIVTVLLMLYAGFLVLTSGGDEEKVKKAKDMIKYIIIGMVLLAGTYVIFRFFVTQDAPAFLPLPK